MPTFSNSNSPNSLIKSSFGSFVKKLNLINWCWRNNGSRCTLYRAWPKMQTLRLPLGSQSVKLKSIYLTMNRRLSIKRRGTAIYRFSVARSSPSGFGVGPISDPIYIWTNECKRLSFFESAQPRLFLFRSREAKPKLGIVHRFCADVDGTHPSCLQCMMNNILRFALYEAVLSWESNIEI